MEGLTDKVRLILKRVGITQPPVDIQRIADFFSIPILPYSKFPDSVSGMIVRENGKSVIGVNTNHPDVRQRFTLAHELGHYLSGHDDWRIVEETFDKDSAKEQEANRFAAELLMPTDFLKADLKKGGSDIPQLAKRYQVSDQAMSVRLIQSGLLTKF